MQTTDCAVHAPEPQGGAPSQDAGKSSPEVGGGAPPCDSPELADIRAELKRDHYLSDANAETLLRMIDELTRSVAVENEANQAMYATLHDARNERDELRAKLAESEAAWRTWNTNMSIEASKWEQRAGELEAKLAEAERERR